MNMSRIYLIITFSIAHFHCSGFSNTVERKISDTISNNTNGTKSRECLKSNNSNSSIPDNCNERNSTETANGSNPSLPSKMPCTHSPSTVECLNVSTTFIQTNSSIKNKTINGSTLTLQLWCMWWRISHKHCHCSNPNLTFICDIVSERDTIQVSCAKDKGNLVEPILAIVISAVGIIGNIMVILIAQYRWKMSRISSKLIAALAVCDFIFCVLTFIDRIQSLWTCKWVYGKVMCKIIKPGFHMAALSGLGFILIIAIERFFGIVYPFNNFVTQKAIYIMCGVNLILSFALVLPQAIALDLIVADCTESFSRQSSLGYSWALMIITFTVPVTIIGILYLRIVYSLRQSQKHAAKTFSASQISERQHEDHRITLIIASLLISFIALVLPNRLWFILRDYDVVDTDNFVITFLIELPYILHAAINPLLYSAVDRTFRHCIKEAFFKVCHHEVTRAKADTMTDIKTAHSSMTIDETV